MVSTQDIPVLTLKERLNIDPVYWEIRHNNKVILI